jgi:hypothetical protein
MRRRLAVLLWLEQQPQEREGKVIRAFSWEDHISRFSEKSFKLRYRLTYRLLCRVLNKISDDIAVDQRMQANSRKGAIIPREVQLAVALRFYAGAMVSDLTLVYEVSSDFVYDSLWRVTDAINKNFPITFNLRDLEKLKERSRAFSDASHIDGWDGQVGSVDGLHIPMSCPTEAEVKNPLIRAKTIV